VCVDETLASVRTERHPRRSPWSLLVAVLQRVAVYCCVLQRVAVYCCVMQRVAVYCCVLSSYVAETLANVRRERHGKGCPA